MGCHVSKLPPTPSTPHSVPHPLSLSKPESLSPISLRDATTTLSTTPSPHQQEPSESPIENQTPSSKEIDQPILKDSSQSGRKDSSQSARKDSSQSARKDSSQSARKDSFQSVRKDSSQSPRKDSSQSTREDSSQPTENDSPDQLSLGESPALTRDLVNNYRFQVAITVKGKEVLLDVFRWTYQGKGSNIKDFIVDNLKDGRKRFKTLFNKEQKKLLDPEVSWDEFDISMLYLLLQNVCGLADPYNPPWKTLRKNSVEHLIYRVKCYRNEIAHKSDIHPLPDQELASKLSDLEDLFSKILHLAANLSRADRDLVDKLVKDIKHYFQTLTANEISELSDSQKRLKESREALRLELQRDCERELITSYPDEYEVGLVHWMFPDLKIQPSHMFTRLMLQEDMSLSRPSEKQQPRDFNYEELLEVRNQDGTLPDVLILSGESGVGKSTLMKYLVEKWVEELASGNVQVTEIKGLREISPLLFLQLRETTVSTWDDMLDRRLTKTLTDSGLSTKDFGQLVKQMHPMILLDGFDEGSQTSFEFIREVLDIPNVRIIVTTRPKSIQTLTSLIPAKKKIMNMKILGINSRDQILYIKKTLTALVADESSREKSLDKLFTKLSEMSFDKEFNTPLNLEMLVILEVETPDVITTGSSTSLIYQEMLNLIAEKVKNRRTLLKICDIEEQLSLYIAYHEKIALQTAMRNESDLSPRTVSDLERKCRDLRLVPPSEVLSGFFASRRAWRGLKLVTIWSYPNGRFHEQWAGNFLFNFLLSIPLTEIPDMSIEMLEDELDNMNPLINILVKGEILTKEIFMKKKIQNILIVLTGLLTQSHTPLLEKIAPAIVSLVNLEYTKNIITIDTLLRLIVESKGNATLLTTISNRIQNHSEWETHGRCLNALPKLLSYMSPAKVFLKFYVDPPERLLKAALAALAEKDLEIHLDVSTPECAELCMEILNHTKSQCSVVSVRGRLSEYGVKCLPISLRKLMVITDWKGLQSLSAKLNSLKHLDNLFINLEDEVRPPPESFSTLPYRGSYLTLWSPRRPPLTGEEVIWWSHVVAELCPRERSPHCSYLDAVLSTGTDAETLLKELHTLGITVAFLEVSTTDNDTDNEALMQMARSLRVCTGRSSFK